MSTHSTSPAAPIAPDPTAKLDDRTGLKVILKHAWVPLVLGIIMALAYFGGFHHPSPNHFPVAIVGPQSQVQPLVNALQSSQGSALDVRSVESKDDAEQLLRDRDIYAAYIPGAHSATLLVASASSEIATSVSAKIFDKVAAQEGVSLTTVDVVALPEQDPLGQNGFFFIVALSVAAYGSGIAIAAAGARARRRIRYLCVGIGTLAISTLITLVAYWCFDMFDGNFWSVWALSLVYVGAVVSFCVGAHTFTSRMSTLVFAGLFVALNFTSSGGVVPPSLQPALFGHLHDFWIGSGAVEAIRNLSYFPALGLGRELFILFTWLAVGIILLALSGWYEARKEAAAHNASAVAPAHSEGSDGKHFASHSDADQASATTVPAVATAALTGAHTNDRTGGRHSDASPVRESYDAELDDESELELEENIAL